MGIAAKPTVGELAALHPAATRVFARHGIDFCCGGAQSLEAACSQAGITDEKLMDDILLEEANWPVPLEQAWGARPLSVLIDHILERHHRPLDTEFPRLEALARKVNAVHGPKDTLRFGEILRVFLALRMELQIHMRKEEQILFPWLRSGNGATAGPPIRVMLMEHESAGVLLAQLRQLTDAYRVPAEACSTWRALWEGLEALEADLLQHIHLENNVLFPRALQGI